MASSSKGRIRGALTALYSAKGPLVAAAALIVVVLWFMGAFETGQIPPGRLAPPESLPAPQVQARAVLEGRPTHYVAVGTVRSRTSATVSSQTNGRLTQVVADAGQAVASGDLLATVDGRELEARVDQAGSALEAARSELNDAQLHHTRMTALLAGKATTQAQMDQADARLRQASANVAAAGKRMEESRIVLGYARVLSPMGGVIESRMADPGDLAFPGKPLFVIHNPRGLRLEAGVREGMISHVEPGLDVEVELPALETTVQGTVEEVIPSADPVSRTFVVRVALPAVERLYPGMFGRLRIRLEDHPAVLVPQEAISDVGQLRTVLVQTDGRWVRRYVTLGQSADGQVEVLSGLSGGEAIGWDPGSGAAPERQEVD